MYTIFVFTNPCIFLTPTCIELRFSFTYFYQLNSESYGITGYRTKNKGLKLILKYCRGKLTDTNKLQAVFKFHSLEKVPFRREEVKENLNRYCFMNFWNRNKEGITNQTNVYRMLGPRHTDAQTNMFLVVKNLIGKMTYGRGEQTSKIWNYQKRKSLKIYKNFYIS